jgi:hypothetical protein
MISNLISFLCGFVTSSIIDTSLGEFSEFAIVGASVVVANVESYNKFYYAIINKNNFANTKYPYLVSLLDLLNFYKIGLVYGLIVDAFKLGS